MLTAFRKLKKKIEIKPSDTIVDTRFGPIKGSVLDSVTTFLGIPYAAPPNQFKEPAHPEPWQSVFDAKDRGPSAPHRVNGIEGIDAVPLVGIGSDGGDGNYLRLNLWKPENACQAPVMVFIHGGGYTIGSKDAPVQDGTAFAKSGIIFIAINYRLGIEGFLPVPGAPTNLGLRDMLFALRWVQDNIETFGGDPTNVTVVGESAGAMAIANLVTSPLAEGLFQRAIIQSGHGSAVREIEDAQRLVRKLSEILGVTPDVQGFRSISTKVILDAIDKVEEPDAIDMRDADGYDPIFGLNRFIPVWGDDVLPKKPIDALRDGAGKNIDILIGTNADEMNLYFVSTGMKQNISRSSACSLLSSSMPHAQGVLKAYGLGKKNVLPGEAMTRAMSDLVFRWPARQFAKAHTGKTWFYEMDWFSSACQNELGACHGIELPFEFKTLDCVTGSEGLVGENPPNALAENIHGIWSRFINGSELPWERLEREIIVYRLKTGETVCEPKLPAADYLSF